MDDTAWTIEVTERDVGVLRRNIEAMQVAVREQELPAELVDDFHQCMDTLGAMLERLRPVGER